MGFLGFGSKWKMASDAGSGAIYDKDKAFTVDEDIIIKSAIHKTRIALAIQDVIKNGYSGKVTQAFKYVKRNFPEYMNKMTISAHYKEYSDLTNSEIDSLKRLLIINLCEYLDIDYTPYESMSDMDLPFFEIETAGLLIPDLSDLNNNDLINGSLSKFYSDLPPNFSKPDPVTGNIMYENITHETIYPPTPEEGETAVIQEGTVLIGSGVEDDIVIALFEGNEIIRSIIDSTGKFYIPLPQTFNRGDVLNVVQKRITIEEIPPISDEEEPTYIEHEEIIKDELITVERTYVVEHREDIILISDEVFRDSFEFEDIDDKYFKVKIPFIKLDKPILYVNAPTQTGETPKYQDSEGNWLGGNAIYTIYYDRTKTTDIQGRYINPTGIITQDRIMTPVARHEIQIYVKPIDSYGYIESKDYWQYRKDPPDYFADTRIKPIVPYAQNYEHSIDILAYPKYVFQDIKRVETINDVEYELLPNEILVRKNSRVLSITARTSDNKIIDKDYQRIYSSIFVDEASASLIDRLPDPSDKYPEEYFNTLPTIPLRDTRGWRHNVDMDSSETFKKEKKLGRILGIDPKVLSRQMYEDSGSSANLMQYIFAHMFVNIRNDDQGSLDYLYRFFTIVEEIQAIGISEITKSWDDWSKSLPSGTTRLISWNPPRNYINHSGVSSNNPSYNFSLVVLTDYLTDDISHKRFGIKFNDKETIDRIYSKLTVPKNYVKSCITYTKRTDNKVNEVSVINFNGSWGVNSWTHRGGFQWQGMKSSGNNSGVLIPIPIGLWDRLPIMVKESLGQRLPHVTYMAAQWNKKSGWSSFFGFALKIIQIVAIALTIWNGVGGAIAGTVGSFGAGVASNVALKSLIKNLVINFIKSKLVTFMLTIAGEAIGIPFLAEIYNIFNTFSGKLSFDIANVLKITNDFAGIISKSLNQSFIKLQQEMIADQEYWKQASEDLAKAQEQFVGENNDKILSTILETPDRFFGRTFGDTIEASFSILESDLLFNFDTYLGD